MKNLTKILATGAIATLMLPTLALAHEDKVKGNLGLVVGIENRLEKTEDREDRNEKHEENNHKDRQVKNATTTAAAVTKQGVRIQAAADTMLSFSDRVGTLIAGADAELKTKLETTFAAFKSDSTNAKVQATAAVSGAAQVNSTNSTTTNATLLAAAKVDLREAKGFLHDAQQGLMQILRSLWNLGN